METDEMIGVERFDDLEGRKMREVNVGIGRPSDVILGLNLDTRTTGGMATAAIDVGMKGDAALEIARVLEGPAQAAAPKPGAWFEVGRRPYQWGSPYGGSGQVIVEASSGGVRLRATTPFEGNDFKVTMSRPTAAKIGALLRLAVTRLTHG